MTLEEQETIIRFDRKYPDATIFTHEPSLKRKLKEMQREYPDIIRLEREDKDSGSVEYIVPKNLIVGIRRPRTVSEDTKEKLNNALTVARNKKRPKDNDSQLTVFEPVMKEE